MTMSNKKIYNEPVEKIIKEINDAQKNRILLVGDILTGKSVVIGEYLNASKDKSNIVIDGTPKCGEYVIFPDYDMNNLLQTCLIVQKMILYVKSNYPNVYLNAFIKIEEKILNILKKLNFVYFLGTYDKKYQKIGQEILTYPEALIEEFLSLATKTLDYETITLVIDNFDSFGTSSINYQRYMYNMLSKYVKFIATVSDREVVNSTERKIELSKENDLIMVNYSKKVEAVKEILDHRISNLVSDEVLIQIIEKTNGNLLDMTRALRNLYINLSKLTKDEIEPFVLNYIDKEINKNPILTGFIVPERKLHI